MALDIHSSNIRDTYTLLKHLQLRVVIVVMVVVMELVVLVLG